MKRYWLLLIVVVAGAFGCRSEFALGDDEERNAQPYADPGIGSTFVLGATITLDGSSSLDPDGSIVAYGWRLTSAPFYSASSPSDPSAAITTMTLDTLGDYALSLSVVDDAGATDTSVVHYSAIGPVTTVDAGPDLQASWRTTVALTGSITTDPAFTTTYSWSLIGTPTGSAAQLTGADTLTPSFFADAAGTYSVRLTSTTPPSAPITDDVVIFVTASGPVLDYTLIDAEYSKQLDRFVIVSDLPPRLRIVNPEDGTESSVALPGSPISVSVHPAGLRAAVGHVGSLSIVDLSTMTVENTFPVDSGNSDVVFGADNRVHCIPSGSAIPRPLLSVNATTGSVSTGASIWPESRARLHPDGRKMYVATTNLSSNRLFSFDVMATPTTELREYYGILPVRGVWITEDGFAVISGIEVFNSSDNPNLDLTERAPLDAQLTRTTWAAHSSAAQRIATASVFQPFTQPAQQLRVYHDQTLAVLEAIAIPDTVYNGTKYPSEGRMVAFKADGSKIYILAKASSRHAIFEVATP